MSKLRKAAAVAYNQPFKANQHEAASYWNEGLKRWSELEYPPAAFQAAKQKLQTAKDEFLEFRCFESVWL